MSFSPSCSVNKRGRGREAPLALAPRPIKSHKTLRLLLTRSWKKYILCIFQCSSRTAEKRLDSFYTTRKERKKNIYDHTLFLFLSEKKEKRSVENIYSAAEQNLQRRGLCCYYSRFKDSEVRPRCVIHCLFSNQRPPVPPVTAPLWNLRGCDCPSSLTPVARPARQ